MTCEFGSCNQESGHDGPHGFDLGGGVILAPYGGGEGKPLDWKDSPVKCDCCSSMMQMRAYQNGGAEFRCTNGGCGQLSRYTRDTASSTVIARLYPSAMTKEWPMYVEFLDYKQSVIDHYENLCSLASVLTAERVEEISQARAWLKSERESLPNRPPDSRLQRFKKWVGLK